MLFSQELMWERVRGRAEGRAEGIAEGRAEGQDIERQENALLLQALREAGREGEIIEAVTDPATRQVLLAEFGIAIQPSTDL